MKLNLFLFYLGFALQLIGLATVGICFVTGIRMGDYGQLELVQLVGGSLVFYIGQIIKVKGSAS